jgi:hypothetical protein
MPQFGKMGTARQFKAGLKLASHRAMNLITLFALSLLLLFLLFLPAETYLRSWKVVKSVIWKKGILEKGEELYLWLDSFGPNEMGVELTQRSQQVGDYKHYNQVLDFIWEEAQKRGAPLYQMIRTLKKTLRQDLKRTTREKELLKEAVLQSGAMLIFIWLYFFAFKFLLEARFKLEMILFLLGFQALGGVVFRFGLKKLRSSIFAPLDTFSYALLELHMIHFRGSLTHARLKESDLKLKGRDAQMNKRLKATLLQWRKQGACQKESVDQLEEDLGHLAHDKEQLFLARLKVLSFAWALFFILPCLFLVSAFGLYALVIV